MGNPKKRLPIRFIIFGVLLAPALVSAMIFEMLPPESPTNWTNAGMMLLSVSIYSIGWFYIKEKRMVSALESKYLFSNLVPYHKLLLIGLAFSLSPITYAFLLVILGMSMAKSEVYFLSVVSYIATLIWMYRWFQIYSKSQGS